MSLLARQFLGVRNAINLDLGFTQQTNSFRCKSTQSRSRVHLAPLDRSAFSITKDGERSARDDEPLKMRSMIAIKLGQSLSRVAFPNQRRTLNPNGRRMRSGGKPGLPELFIEPALGAVGKTARRQKH